MNYNSCKYYLPWVNTSREEINDACVNNEKRTIKRCDHWNKPEACPDYKTKEDKK